MGKDNPALERGFSLIEVVVGIAVLTIIAIGIMPLFTESTANMHRSRSSSQALRLARMKIEDIKEEIDDKKNDPTVDFDDYWNNQLNQSGEENNFAGDLEIRGDFKREFAISDYSSNLKEVQVVVKWDDNRSIELKNLITKR